MRGGLIDRLSAQIARFTFAALVVLGAVLVISLLYSVGDPQQEFIALNRDRDAILGYLANTFFLFFLSILVQASFFFWGTMYVRRPSNFAKVSLILPFATGTIAPAAGLYTLFSSQIGPFPTSWFIGSTSGARWLIALIDAWQWTGVLLFLAFAYIERISPAHFQQATLEGISRFQQWKLIVWPAVSRMVAIYVAIKALDWVRKFEIIRILFGDGGPGEAVKTFAMYAATRSYDAGMDSYASALALAQVVVLLVCIIVAFRTLMVPNDLGRTVSSEPPTRRVVFGVILFSGVLILALIAPVLWLVSMSLQPSDVIFRGGFRFWPTPTTAENFRQFAPWNDAWLFRNLTWSIIFYGSTTACAMLLALNETYRLTVHSNPQRERQRFATVIGIFFLPAFAVFSAVELLKLWTSVRLDIYALFVLSTANGYALGFAATYMAFKYGFRHRYEQLVLEFESPVLAFWKGIVWPQLWIVCVATILVFTASWNELFLSDKWTSGGGWRPFAVVIGTTIQQYGLKYSTLAAGAVISMLTPLVLGVLLYILMRIPEAVGRTWSGLHAVVARTRNRTAMPTPGASGDG